jgi:hypothetical protein
MTSPPGSASSRWTRDPSSRNSSRRHSARR